MTRLAVLAAAVSVAVASLSGVTQAHNYVLKPRAPFKSGISGMGNWVAEFKPPFSGDVSNGKSFMALAKKNNVASVRSFIENRGPDCGNTDPNAKAQAIPSDKKVQLYRSMDHPGPCELWIDSTMVYHNDDCKAAWGGATPNIPVDFSSCKGNCMLRFYWLGLQDKGQRMQSYKNCIPLTGGGGGATRTNGKARSMDDEDLNESYSFGDLNVTDSA
jgi:hypothetical protein